MGELLKQHVIAGKMLQVQLEVARGVARRQQQRVKLVNFLFSIQPRLPRAVGLGGSEGPKNQGSCFRKDSKLSLSGLNVERGSGGSIDCLAWSSSSSLDEWMHVHGE